MNSKKVVIKGIASWGLNYGVFDREDTNLFNPPTNLLEEAIAHHFDGKKVRVTIEEL